MEFVLVDSIDEALRVAMPDEFKVRVSEARAGRAPEREVREVAAASQSGGDSTF
jgi:hypothetical protein